jgi:hypothetical protein
MYFYRNPQTFVFSFCRLFINSSENNLIRLVSAIFGYCKCWVSYVIIVLRTLAATCDNILVLLCWIYFVRWHCDVQYWKCLYVPVFMFFRVENPTTREWKVRKLCWHRTFWITDISSTFIFYLCELKPFSLLSVHRKSSKIAMLV